MTSPTNQRTMIASFIPFVVKLRPIILTGDEMRASELLFAREPERLRSRLSLARDRQCQFELLPYQQFPIRPPDAYQTDALGPAYTRNLDQQRVLKLLCTAEDMIPLAKPGLTARPQVETRRACEADGNSTPPISISAA
jgi:hypothetical protein